MHADDLIAVALAGEGGGGGILRVPFEDDGVVRAGVEAAGLPVDREGSDGLQ